MSTDSQFDFDAAIAQIFATRPRQQRGEPLGFDVVSWAIRTLEEFGIHPSLSTIARVIGPGGSQRVLKPLVNRYYLDRVSQSAQRATVDSDEHLMALYDCVASRVRKQVEERLADEHREIAEARSQLEHVRSMFESEREGARQQLLLAESIRTEVQEEMGKARAERREMQERAESMSKSLGEMQSEVRDSALRIEDLTKQNAMLTSKLKSATTSVGKLRYELARSSERETANAKTLRDRSDAIEQRTKEARALQIALQSSAAKHRDRERQHSELEILHRKVSSELERVQAKLARERASVASLKPELRNAKASHIEAEKSAVRAKRDLQAMRTARDRAVAAASEALAEGESLRRRLERLEARLRKHSATPLEESGAQRTQSSRQ